MKKKLVLLLLCAAICVTAAACSSKSKPAPEPAAPAAETEPDFDEIFAGLEPRGDDDESEPPMLEEIMLETAILNGAFDEVCSYQIAYPQTPDVEYAALNALFEEDAMHLKAECADRIYEKAAARSCVATVDGTCDCFQDGSTLYVEYMLEAAYSDSEEKSYIDYAVQYDLTTCTRTEALS